MDFGKFSSPKTSTYNQGGKTGNVQLVSFNQQNGALSSINYDTVESRNNWNYAALNVGLWNVVLVVGLAIPVAAFVKSFEYKPVQNPDYG